MSRIAVGMEIEGDNLKLACLRREKKKFELVNLIDKNIRGFSDDDISNFIRATLVTDFRIKKPRVTIVISSSVVTTKNIEIPSIDSQEIEGAVDLQAGRHTPYSREEVTIGYTPITTYQAKYTKVLLVIAHKDAIRQKIDILNKGNLTEGRIVFIPEAVAQWYYSLLEPKEKNCFAVFHINVRFTDFMVVKEGKLAFVRTLPLGRIHLSRNEFFYRKFEQEIENSLESYEKEGIAELPKKLVISGALKDMEELELSLKGIPLPIEVIPYYKNLTIPAKLEEIAKSTSFLPLIVSLIQENKLTIDLLPVDLKMQRSVEAKGKEIIKTGILIAVIFSFIWGIFLTKVYTRTTYLKKLMLKYEDLNNEAKVWEEGMAKLKVIKDYLARQGKFLEVLSSLYQAVPQTMYLSGITFDRRKNLNIKGTSDFMAEVFSFVSSLEASDCFKNVKIKYTTKRKEKGKELAVFEITSNLE